VGRGAPYFLRHRPDAFHVFLYAPMEERIRRVLAMGKQESEAFELVTTIDKERAAFIKRYFNAEWPNRHLYHLMINTKAGDELVIDLILNEVRALDEKSAAVFPER
jgi:cytidylate kinase